MKIVLSHNGVKVCATSPARNESQPVEVKIPHFGRLCMTRQRAEDLLSLLRLALESTGVRHGG